MLVKLTVEQIADSWNAIKYAVNGSLPPVANESYDKMTRILESLMNETMQCWISYKEIDKVRKLKAILITSITSDMCSNIKNLFIYSLYGFDLDDSTWSEGYDTFSKWGKENGCNRIVAYTDVSRIIDIVKQYGGEAKYTFISVPL